MALVAPTLNGVTLPHVSRFDYVRLKRGGRLTLASGKVATSLITGSKHVFTLSWLALTEANMTTIEGAVDAAEGADVTFRSPRDLTYTVRAAADSDGLQVQAVRAAGGLRFNVTIVLREQ
jgi:hypothetical protein